MMQARYLVVVLSLLGIFFVPVHVVMADPGHDESTAHSTLKDRVENRKVEQKVTLEATQKANIQKKCKGAQAALGKARTKSTAAEKRSFAVYEKLDNKVESLMQKLNTANIASADLLQANETVEGKVTALRQPYDAYQQSLEDATAIDCTANPEDFKAALQEARTKHREIKLVNASLRKTISEVLLPAINDAKKAIETAKTVED